MYHDIRCTRTGISGVCMDPAPLWHGGTDIDTLCHSSVYPTEQKGVCCADYLQGWIVVLCVRLAFSTFSLCANILLYFRTICIVTLVLTVMISAAPPGLKNITAQLELLLVNEIDKIRLLFRLTHNFFVAAPVWFYRSITVSYLARNC
jgi:hypothetical protein